jgi:hypothetical protein
VARLREQVDNLRNGLAHWKTIAETESWPYEWDVATVIKTERDEARAEVARLRAAGKALWDTFDVDDEGSGFVNWTTKPRHVERFERAFGIDQDAA